MLRLAHARLYCRPNCSPTRVTRSDLCRRCIEPPQLEPALGQLVVTLQELLVSDTVVVDASAGVLHACAVDPARMV